MTCRKKCRRDIRIQLACFATANYLLGLATFMFFLCSNSPTHMNNLGEFVRNPIGFVSGTTFEPEPHHHHH